MRVAAPARSGPACAAAVSPRPSPERRDQQARRLRRGSRGGRPPAFDPAIHRRPNVVERCFGRPRQYRTITTRYDKTAQPYQGLIDLATLLMRL
ncbi:transposase [Actinoallomurus acaciae]|uniref:Transposase n=1 Tax=Actinoallomurus acaciae TaxID=502577 RepID=A0ABV5YCD8_9ACTN